jgi:DNA-binding transcriptional LysR family regulator
MTFEQLNIFVAVAEREHMTAGARTLNITQSAASAAIAALEERHQIKLFHRVGRGIVLSEAGLFFLEEARSVLARAKAAETVLDELSGLRRGTLRLVASQTIAAYWLPSFLAIFANKHPLLEIDVAIGNTEQAAARVHTGGADLGIIEGEINDPVLAQWPIGEDQLLLVQAAPFESQTIDADWLRRAKWIMRERGSGTRSTLETYLQRIGVNPETLITALTLPSNESVRTATEAGAGIAALSSLVVRPVVEAGKLHAASVDMGRRPFFAIRHKERYRSKAADALLAILPPVGR